MTKRFLCVWSTEQSTTQAKICDSPTDALRRRHGRAGALFPALQSGPEASLSGTSIVAFLVPRSSTELLATLVNDLGSTIAESTYLTYGHACTVLILPDQDRWLEVHGAIEPLLRGFEVWSVDADNEGSVTKLDLKRPDDGIDEASPPDISAHDLRYEGAAQVRQFNANLAVLARSVRHYAPQMWPLITNIRKRVDEIAAQLRLLETKDDDLSARQAVTLQSVLIETNAVVTLFCSQLGSGTLPLGSGRFPVGEYSLFGIGAALNAAWQIYHHLSRVFAQHDQASVLVKYLPTMDPFGWSGPTSTTADYSAWTGISRRLQSCDPEAETEPRLHVPYFSSRWGFHESLHSISLSWQCISASASKEWNLLTLTHEFLHSRVRAMVAQLFNPETDPALATTLVRQYNARADGESALESLRLAYVEALLVARRLTKSAKANAAGDGFDAEVPATITPEYLIDTYRTGTELVQEVIVHVLDYRYIFASRPEDYIDSIWSSWALVPNVVDRIEHYLLRTMCTLSIDVRGDSHFERFETIRSNLIETFTQMNTRPIRRPAIVAALDVLTSEEAYFRLALDFCALIPAAQIAQNFFVARAVNVAVLKDESATTDGDRTTYEIEPGQYLGLRPESPIGFLLDRFPEYADRAGEPGMEYLGLWQMLQLG